MAGSFLFTQCLPPRLDFRKLRFQKQRQNASHFFLRLRSSLLNRVLAIYSLTLVRYICFANSIYPHFIRLRYDINSLNSSRRDISHYAVIYLTEGISQIPSGIYIAEKSVLKFPVRFFHGGATQTRTGDIGVADLCLTTWPWRLITKVTHQI